MCDLLRIAEIKGTQTKLSHLGSWTSSHYACPEDVEELPHGEEIYSKNGQYDSKVFIWATRSKFQEAQMVVFP